MTAAGAPGRAPLRLPAAGCLLQYEYECECQGKRRSKKGNM